MKDYRSYDITNVYLKGNWYVYTEMIDHGKDPILKAHDRVFLGTSEGYANTKNGDEGAKRLVTIYEEKACDGVCQLCNSSCNTKRIVEI